MLSLLVHAADQGLELCAQYGGLLFGDRRTTLLRLRSLFNALLVA